MWLLEKWSMYYSTMYECKGSEKFIQVKNELNAKWNEKC